MIPLSPAIIFLAALYLAGSAILSARRRGRRWTAVEPGDRAPRRVRALVSPISGIVAALALAPLIAYVALSGRLAAAVGFLIGALGFSAAIDAAAILRWPLARDGGRTRLVTGGIAIALTAAIAGFQGWIYSAPGGRGDAIEASLPFRGEWECVAGGRWAFRNHHHGNPIAQNYAVDFVRAGAPGVVTRGEPVLSPVAGRIVRAMDGTPEDGTGPAEGNHLVIRMSDGTELWLTHLQRGSLTVRAGDRVTEGQAIAACGDSGSASGPHLHLHAERSGEPVPILFREAQRRRWFGWRRPRRAFVVYGDRIRSPIE